MLSVLGKSSGGFCDDINRRGFLRIGGLALGGLSLTQLLRAEQRHGTSSHKAIIMVLLPGGPPHLDMFDMKPNAPVEVRGEFSPIATNVPGIQITELMPRTAAMMDKLAIIRSLHGGRNDHNVHLCLTGWESHPKQGDSTAVPGYPSGVWPSIGAVLSKKQGRATPAVPAFVSLAPPTAESTTRASLNQAGFLGAGHAGFEPNRRKRSDIQYRSGVRGKELEKQREQVADIVLQGITLDRLSDRNALLASLDGFRRDVDAGGMVDSLDTIQRQALGILTSSRLAEALNWKDEDLQSR